MRKEIKTKGTRGTRAFTLIELLVVIAIIGVLAGLLIPLAGIATTKMRIARVKAELNNYVTAIESYKLEVGAYPPDNGLLKQSTPGTNYQTRAALSPLFYELTGAVFTNKQFQVVTENEVIRTNELGTIFGRDGIVNSARARFDIPYKGFSPKESQYAELDMAGDVEILAVPVPGPFTLPGRVAETTSKKTINPWFYDASTTNRNNRATFDFWAEITVGGKVTVIGNWKN